MTKLLFILDWTLFLPVTLVRLCVIYFNGSKYNIDGLKFLDVMMHSDNKYFNQSSESEPSIDTTTEDVRKIIKYDSHLYEMTEIKTDLMEGVFKKDNEKTVTFEQNDETDFDSDSKSSTNTKIKSNSGEISGSDSESDLNNDMKESDNEGDGEEEGNLDFLIKSAKIKINNMMNK